MGHLRHKRSLYQPSSAIVVATVQQVNISCIDMQFDLLLTASVQWINV